MAFGSLLLNISNPKNFEPFILISLLLSMALVPILLTKRKAPQFKKINPIKIKELYKISLNIKIYIHTNKKNISFIKNKKVKIGNIIREEIFNFNQSNYFLN